MINKYRKKFIFVTMLSLFVVLGIVICVINVINYIKVCKDSDQTIEMIQNDSTMFGIDAPPVMPFDGGKPNDINREDRFRTRFFQVTFNNDENNTLVSANAENISLSQEEAVTLARTILSKNSSRGFYSIYRYKVDKSNNHTTVIVLDCAKERISNNQFLITSLIISSAGYLIVFGIMVIVSKIVVKPFYENMEKQKQFITDASHELKTPLTIMSADIEVLEIENGENEWLNSIKNQINRLTTMTKNLTLMAKTNEDKTTYEMNDFDISSKLNEAIDDITTLLRTKDKNLVTEIEEGIIIHANEELIRELFMILLENSYKYSLGDVFVQLKKDGKNIELEFSNDAIVPDGNLDYLFDRFYRLDSSRNSKTGGNGIGLALAKTIVDIHGGVITANGHNKRITFNITFKA